MSLKAIFYCGAMAVAAAAGSSRVAEAIPADQAEKIRAAAPAKPSVQPKKPRRVLIWNTPPHLMPGDPHKGYCIPYGTVAMVYLGCEAGAFHPVVSDDLAVYLPESLKQFDAIVMNNSSGPWITPSAADMAKEAFRKLGLDKAAIEQVLRKSLLDYVRGGGGVVAYHYAIGANSQWPEFQELLGAKFTGHPWNEEVGIRVEEPTHPLVAAFGGKDFRLADEIYQFGDPYSRKHLRVLLSLDTSRTNMNVKEPLGRKDGDFAQAWVKPYGKGRVFYTGFGHRTEIYWNPAILQFYLDGIQFACGDLDAPLVPRTTAPVR
jgi:type 1 glutamine amidotransferase